MFKNNFWKTLAGDKRIEVIVGSAVAYTDDTTYEAFITNSVEGEIGFFNADTKAVISGAIGATTRFFLALKRGGRIFKTTPSLGSEVKKTKVAYVAPVKQITDIGFGTKATLTVGNIVYTARAGGTGGNSITITVVDPAGNNAALSVGVVSNDITINLATDGASAPTSTGSQVLAALQASAAAMALVSVAGTGTMTTVQAAAAQTALAGGAAATAPTAGEEYNLEIMDLTTQAQPFPTYMYSYVAKTGDTIASVIAALVALINDTTSFANRDRDLIVTATSGTGVLTLTAKDYGVTFNVLLQQKTYTAASASVRAKMKLGSGYYEQAAEMELAGDIYGGVQTQYPETHTAPDDWGKPPSLVLSTNTYNMYQWSKIPWENSRTPHNQWSPGLKVFGLAVPSNGTNPSSTVDTILGV
jgi:hypothetical protein